MCAELVEARGPVPFDRLRAHKCDLLVGSALDCLCLTENRVDEIPIGAKAWLQGV
jgi:hypothetical protein